MSAKYGSMRSAMTGSGSWMVYSMGVGFAFAMKAA